MEIDFHENKKGRIYQKGLHLSAQEIKTIHKLLETKDALQVSKELKMDVRTIRKYSNGNSFIKVGGRLSYNDEVKSFTKELVKQNPTIYLQELKEKIKNDNNIEIGISSLCRMLQNLGFTRKKVVKIAYYRTLDRIQLLRARFRDEIKDYHPYNFVYIDESHFDSKTKEVFYFF